MYEQYGMPQNPMQLAQQLMGSYQQRVAPQQLIRVTGMDGAKAYQMGPNSCVPLFDSDNDIMYIKSTDGAGFPTVRAFSFAPIEEPREQARDYVTREELDEFERSIREMVENGKQPVSGRRNGTRKDGE